MATDDERTVGRRTVLAGAGAAAASALAGCAGRFSGGLDETTTITESYDAAGLEALTAETTNGELTVTGEDRGTVALEAVKSAGSRAALEATTVEVSREGSLLAVTVDEPDTGVTDPSPRVDLELTVPADLRVQRAVTVNGDVDVEGVFGPLVARSTNGDVTATGINGDVDVELVNGDVEVDGVDGSVSVETVNGDIEVRQVTGDATVQTTNGDVDISGVDGTVTT